MRKEKIGILGGTFDPIHLGHLNLAAETLEKHQLDQVWFIPAGKNPFKVDAQQTPSQHRLKMVQLAIAEHPKFRVLDIECKAGELSYTVDTLRKLTEENPNASFRLIITDELLPDFNKWKDPEEIKKLAPLLIGSRKAGSISSTDIRSRLKSGKDCSHLVPKPILDYIKANDLYPPGDYNKPL